MQQKQNQRQVVVMNLLQAGLDERLGADAGTTCSGSMCHGIKSLPSNQEVFSPVADNTVCRMLMSMANACNYEIDLVDIFQAF